MKFFNFLITEEFKVPKDVPLHKVLRMLKTFGYTIMKEGSHIIMRNRNNKTISIPHHKQVKSSTLRKIIGEAGIDRNRALAEL
jgi:predicted RNA binding protein YcfA (HicA-like mRNA interferase family)